MKPRLRQGQLLARGMVHSQPAASQTAQILFAGTEKRGGSNTGKGQSLHLQPPRLHQRGLLLEKKCIWVEVHTGRYTGR